MKRREFIGFSAARRQRGRCGARAAARAHAAHRHTPTAAADDPEWQARVGAFQQGLGQLGWNIGRNVQIDNRWATTNAADIRKHAAELVALAPDVILAAGTPRLGPLLQATHTVPIVFVTSSIRSVPASSIAWRGRAATPPVLQYRIQHQRKMAGAAQRDRAGRDARGGPSGCHTKALQSASLPRSRPWRRRSGWRSARSICRRRRDRARRRGFRALLRMAA